MLISEYLAQRNQLSVTTGNAAPERNKDSDAPKNSDGNTFAEELRQQLSGNDIEFSGHAIKRLESRNIDVTENDRLERLSKGVELAAEKGCDESLILVDSTAFVVSIRNRTVITTMSQDDIKGNVFTNIDSTVII